MSLLGSLKAAFTKKQVAPERKHKLILSNEDWYPTYEDGTVKVSFMRLPSPKRPATWRVAVWGADDFGLEMDTKDRGTALRMFDRIVNLTTQSELKKWGFIRA